MTVGLDTSVLVAALVGAHPRHLPSRAWLAAAAAGRVDARVALHAAAETWSVLTRAPLPAPLDGATARALVTAALAHAPPLPCDAVTYDLAVERCVSAGLRGGAVHDALHLVSAERAGADLLLTWNPRDFERLRPALRVATPDLAPPG